MDKYFIGIDPGASKAKGHGAGVAVINEQGRPIDTYHAPIKKYSVGVNGKDRIMVDTNELLNKLIKSRWYKPFNFNFATIEHPQPLPNEFNVPIKATCELFMHYGTLNSILELMCERILPVHPRSWKRGYNLPADKDAALDLARKMFPSIKLSNKQDHNIGEALLLAEYGRLTYLKEKHV